ncbi:MAG TPA: hypothetical protein ENI07_08135 [Desulfobacterales bacterium]|nr:hypothetical protein [Desulfobacterales bacterium]
MEDKRYKITFDGTLSGGMAKEGVKKNLAFLYNMNAEKIERIFFAGSPTVIKKSVDYKTAIKIKAAFNRAGAVCEIQEITKQGNDIPSEREVSFAFLLGNDLVEMMREYDRVMKKVSNINSTAASSYHAYVMGVCDAQGGKLEYQLDADSHQTCAIVGVYLKAHPEKWHQSAAQIVLEALKNASLKQR